MEVTASTVKCFKRRRAVLALHASPLSSGSD